MIRRLEFHVSYVCGQSCLFCSEAGRMSRYRGEPLRAEELARVLAVKRRQGFDHVTFTGGEPTAHPRFLGILAAARGLGFKTYVTSNGSKLAGAAFARKALPLIDELCLSIHGDTAALHEAQTGASGGFEKLLRAFRHAGEAGIYLLTNMVVTRRNWDRLEATLELAASQRGVRHCLLSHVAPEGRGEEAYASLAMGWDRWRERAPALARLAAARRVTLRVFGVPLCALGACRELSNDLYFSPRVTVERGEAAGRPGLVEITSLRPTRGRAKSPRCSGCAVEADCGGVFERHLAEFGDADLRPF